MRRIDGGLELEEGFGVQAELVDAGREIRLVQQAQHDFLAVDGGHDRDAQVVILVAGLHGDAAVVRQPLLATETAEKFDVLILTNGGGHTGQAGAARLGIARALLEFNSELRGKLKELGFLSRDARIHERKKYGQKGARKRFQFSKR